MSIRHPALLFVLAFSQLVTIQARALVLVAEAPIPGARGIEIVGDLAYVTSFGQPGLHIFDISNPTSPVKVASRADIQDAAVIKIDEGHAYITEYDSFPGALLAFDVSNPIAPFQVGTLAADLFPFDVEVERGVAYYAEQAYLPDFLFIEGALRTVDITNPSVPTTISTLDWVLMWDIEVANSILYVAWLGGLEVIDASNPAAMSVVGSFPDIQSADVEISNGLLYGVGTEFEVFDLSNPVFPQKIGSAPVGTGTSRFALSASDLIEVVGDHAYVGGRGFKTLDISDLSAINRLGSMYSRASDMVVRGQYAYLAGDSAFRVVDLNRLDKPAVLGSAAIGGSGDEPGGASDIVVSNGIAYLAVGIGGAEFSARGLRIFDVTDPSAPVERGGIDTADRAWDVEVQGGHAFLAAERDGLRIIDVTDPDAPVGVGTFTLPGGIDRVEVVADVAFVVHWQSVSQGAPPFTLRAVDVSDTAAPVEIGAAEFTEGCSMPGFDVVNGFAYLTCRNLSVFDVSNPAQPTRIFSGLGPFYSASSIDVEGDLAYIGDERARSVRVVDVSNPAFPVELASAPGHALSVIEKDRFVYGVGESGLFVQDVTNSHEPVLLGGFPSKARAWRGVAVENGLVFAAAGEEGLQIIDLGREYSRAKSVEIAIRAIEGGGPINLASRGVVSVAILGSKDFDVAQVDRSTLRFGPGAAQPAHSVGGHPTDLDDDGYTDLVSHYRIGELGFGPGEQEACLSGELLDGTPFEGCDSIRAVATGRGSRR